MKHNPMSINPIPTIYQGVTFRSRLEARWAVFFDYLNIKWLFENEGYETPYGRYVPDFWLPEMYLRSKQTKGILFEVKPPGFGHSHDALEYVADQLGVGAMLTNGFNEPGNYDELYQIAPGWDNYMMVYVCSCSVRKFDFTDSSYCECPVCGRREDSQSFDRVKDAYNHARNYSFW